MRVRLQKFCTLSPERPAAGQQGAAATDLFQGCTTCVSCCKGEGASPATGFHALVHPARRGLPCLDTTSPSATPAKSTNVHATPTTIRSGG
eukprot:6489005-Amphidinium_carterae.1